MCIHGFPTASWDWHKLWPGLTDRFRVVAPDMLGFGFSDKPRSHAYSLFTQATLHEVLLHHLGLSDVHLLAHDYGDTVVQELLARHQKRQAQDRPGLRIKSVCLLNGGLFPEATRPRPIQKLLRSPLGWLVGLFMNRRRFGENFSKVFGARTKPTDQELDEFYRLISHNRGHRLSHKLLHYIADRHAYRDIWIAALQNSAVPIKLINGGADPISGRHVYDYFKEMVPNAEAVCFDDIGHYPQTEAPVRVLAELRGFL